jgi:hypothetical protein
MSVAGFPPQRSASPCLTGPDRRPAGLHPQAHVRAAFELSHLSLRVLGLEFLFCWHCEELTHLDRCAAGDDGFASPRHGLIHVGCVKYPKAANVFLGLEVWSIGDDHLSAGRRLCPLFPQEQNLFTAYSAEKNSLFTAIDLN